MLRSKVEHVPEKSPVMGVGGRHEKRCYDSSIIPLYSQNSRNIFRQNKAKNILCMVLVHIIWHLFACFNFVSAEIICYSFPNLEQSVEFSVMLDCQDHHLFHVWGGWSRLEDEWTGPHTCLNREQGSPLYCAEIVFWTYLKYKLPTLIRSFCAVQPYWNI